MGSLEGKVVHSVVSREGRGVLRVDEDKDKAYGRERESKVSKVFLFNHKTPYANKQ
jgi:hypothetical protein